MAAKGILGRKVGMTQVWDAQNRVVPVTVIEAGPCRVVQLKTPERDGYAAVQLAFGATKASRLSKPELGHLEKTGAEPARELAELRVDDLSGYEVGQVIAADVFSAGDVVDVTGISKGKGFTGVMQRHNFKGQGASHGNHKKHRAPGAIGACATPARVFKGVRMAGQHGSERVTTLNLEVVEGDPERGLLLVKGSVPGSNGSIVFVRNAVKGPKVGPYEPRAKAEPEVAEPDTDHGVSYAVRASADGVSPAAASDAVETADKGDE
jgi:large subunit ribosomal protein L3